ncbi:hypothetical protein SAMN05444166_7737 [Singulisphaera sp. GP187]|uniref:hypothetical protein n=1 Tax=Singulisphaera sp. GP187 TaxID=1882752 RepID=UPI0009298DAB|nr:hypothetical protein [Singulisphaera sp. GP187]SIO65560.1 hypothetical protein SAMN05444166_7737 [Singulisphaera sp. GP187]
MRYARPVTFAALLLVVQSGCRTAGVDNLARQAPVVARPQLEARTLVTEHNRNAERIEKISAKPSLSVSKGRRPMGAANGYLALERPRNFRLEVRSTGGDVADIGSNDEKFWYWTKDNDQKAIFYCDYDESGKTPLSPAVLQPEWIVEALGLRVITENEAAGCTVTRGKDPDTLVLTLSPTRAGGETVTRVVVISESTRRIKEHRLFAGDSTLIARAIIEDYLSVPDGNHPEETVYLPKKMKLEWVRDRLNLEVAFAQSSTKINEEFPADKYAALFVEDPRQGYDRINLVTLFAGAHPPQQQAQGPTTLRETLPAPPAGVHLSEPVPLGVDGAMRTERDPVALSSTRGSLSDELLGPALPTAPEPSYAKPEASSRWRASSVSMER